MSISSFDAALGVYLSAAPEERAELDIVLNTEQSEFTKLLLIRAEGKTITKEQYAEASAVLNLSDRQIQRKLKSLMGNVPPPVRRPFELTEHHIQVIFACCGNVKRAYHELFDDAPDAPSHSVFWRAWHERHPTATQETARRGGEAMANYWIYTPFTAPERNTVWQADHFELPIDVVADGHGTRLVKPWLTLFVDDTTRKVMAWALTAQPDRRPDAETVLATIAAGIRIRLEDGAEVGGIPQILRWDNDRSFTAGMVTALGARVGFECHCVPPYSGHMKGKIERLGRRVQEQFVMLLPGYTHGPKTLRMIDPFRDTVPLTGEQVRGRLALWFAEYDNAHHEGIGTTPMTAWRESINPLRRVTDEQLRDTLLKEPRPRKVVLRKGVPFRGQYWASAELQRHVGKHVEVRYPIMGDDFIEVYRNGQWLCTAWPADSLTESQKRALWDGRDEPYRDGRAHQERAKEIRAGAEAQIDTSDATPSIASMPEVDPLASDLDDLLDLIGDDLDDESGENSQ
ncbi:MAG TPA: DDE-type integrase/transposase/recombinase [Acidimicrobiales bacterium]|nr:DDE-type integrase/transposase/recombinase [Acidimicrobiales bacterium]